MAAAKRAAETLATEHHKHRELGGRPALLAERQAAEAAAAEAERAKEEAARTATTTTLAALLGAYCDHLAALGRPSHKDARSIFNLHIKKPWPQFAKLPAIEVTSDQVADMMRRLFEQGKGRTANKLRSYVQSAYQTAKAARSKASIPVLFKEFGIVSNPASDTMPDESQNQADKNPLTTEQMRTYWQILLRTEGVKGTVLRLHLLTGGQRIQQFVKLKTVDIVPSSRITLFDGKGRPGKPPRPHTVPLVEEANKALTALSPRGKFALSTDSGKTHIAATTLSKWAVEIVGDTIPDFQAKRVRSGVETLLASVGVPQDIRGRLQSHGISGVQNRHYDGHDYLSEKYQALTSLLHVLVSPTNLKAPSATDTEQS